VCVYVLRCVLTGGRQGRRCSAQEDESELGVYLQGGGAAWRGACMPMHIGPQCRSSARVPCPVDVRGLDRRVVIYRLLLDAGRQRVRCVGRDASDDLRVVEIPCVSWRNLKIHMSVIDCFFLFLAFFCLFFPLVVLRGVLSYCVGANLQVLRGTRNELMLPLSTAVLHRGGGHSSASSFSHTGESSS